MIHFTQFDPQSIGVLRNFVKEAQPVFRLLHETDHPPASQIFGLANQKDIVRRRRSHSTRRKKSSHHNMLEEDKKHYYMRRKLKISPRSFDFLRPIMAESDSLERSNIVNTTFFLDLLRCYDFYNGLPVIYMLLVYQ
ncbi:Hypothetical predicted protein [Cloeon dipterum]|uniref:Uncharacterized protein n=1 Tax=Cloeon dipterum TaxID=197152 RepID=A0A8S1D7P7_9INSE|nr:Hypothetical predicted protein [Cloeon dipterum]